MLRHSIPHLSRRIKPAASVVLIATLVVPSLALADQTAPTPTPAHAGEAATLQLLWDGSDSRAELLAEQALIRRFRAAQVNTTSTPTIATVTHARQGLMCPLQKLTILRDG